MASENGVKYLKKMLIERFEPLIREKQHQDAFAYATKVLDSLERFDNINEKETMYLFLHVLIIQAFNRLDTVKELLKQREGE
jgi:hypothetical protein